MILDFHSLLAIGSFGGITPLQAKFQPYKSVEFLSNFQNVKLPCTNEKPPTDDFLSTVLNPQS